MPPSNSNIFIFPPISLSHFRSLTSTQPPKSCFKQGAPLSSPPSGKGDARTCPFSPQAVPAHSLLPPPALLHAPCYLLLSSSNGSRHQKAALPEKEKAAPLPNSAPTSQPAARQLLRFSSLPESTKRKGGAATGDVLVKTRWRKVVQTPARLLLVELKPSATVANGTHAHSDTNQASKSHSSSSEDGYVTPSAASRLLTDTKTNSASKSCFPDDLLV